MKKIKISLAGFAVLVALSACGGGIGADPAADLAPLKRQGGSAAPAAAPLAPTLLKAIALDAAVRLEWAMPDGAQVDSYTIERSTNGASYTTLATLQQSAMAGATGYLDRTSKNGSKYYYRVRANSGGQAGAYSNTDLATPSTLLDTALVSWPLPALAGMTRADADANNVRFQFGPRYSGGYDFHAGIDLPAPEGTDVYAVMAGEVDAIGNWDGVSTGPGNFVRIRHQATPGGEMKYTAYLHLSSVSQDLHVADGANGVAASKVDASTVLGQTGRAGASWPHLHFTYMVGTSGGSATGNAEKKSKNPLEILPHTQPTASGVFNNETAEISLRSNLTTVRWIVAKGTIDGVAVERIVDYYAVVDLGEDERNVQSQNGLQLEALAPLDASGRSTKVQGGYLLKISSATPEAGMAAMRITSVQLFDDKNAQLLVLQRQ